MIPKSLTDQRRRQITLAALVLLCLSVAATGFTAETNDWVLPRTADGRPDLAGVWDFRTLTPLQRSEDLGDKAVLTEEEVAQIEAKSAAEAVSADEPSDADREAPPAGANVGAYNNFWFDRGAGVVEDRRTSLIVDPKNGRFPPLQPGVKTQVLGDDLPTDLPVRLRVGGIGTDGPESRGLAERCLLGFNSGPPIIPGGYNQNIGISQTPDHVVILNEMVHDARIIPLGGPPRLPVRRWMGDSRGSWEGDALVVETTNFTDKTSSFSSSVFSAQGTGEHLQLTEKFQRIDENTLRYEFTVNDPATYTSSITAVLHMKKTDDRIYEYACHEGNYAIRNMLAGARTQERLAAEGKSLGND